MQVQHHVENECEKTVVDCTFQSVGCGAKVGTSFQTSLKEYGYIFWRGFYIPISRLLELIFTL